MTTITLEDGRVIGIEPVAPHEAMTIAAGCRELSGVRQWWQTAMSLAAIRTINGIPRPLPTHARHVEGLIREFSRDDLNVIANVPAAANDAAPPRLELVELTPLETLRLWAVIGEYEAIPGWVAPAFIAAQVRKIDGEDVTFPASKEAVKDLVARLGVPGMTVASAFLVAGLERAKAVAADKQAAAKN
jgi:hypothetical protein